jgi:hypothetical protein
VAYLPHVTNAMMRSPRCLAFAKVWRLHKTRSGELPWGHKSGSLEIDNCDDTCDHPWGGELNQGFPNRSCSFDKSHFCLKNIVGLRCQYFRCSHINISPDTLNLAVMILLNYWTSVTRGNPRSHLLPHDPSFNVFINNS